MWNGKFLFLLPSPPLNSSSLLILIFSSSPFPLLPEPLLGSVHLLFSNHRLSQTPQFIVLNIGWPSGQFHGVLNLSLVVVSHVPGKIWRALKTTNVVRYRDLIEVGVLKEVVHLNKQVVGLGSKSKEEEEEEVEKAMRQMCGLGLGIGRMMLIHSSLSDQNLHSSLGFDDDDDNEKENKIQF